MYASSCSSVVMASIAIFVTLPLFSSATSLDVNNQQVLDSSNLLADINVFSKHMFKILTQPDRCSYRSLTRCHIDEEMYYFHYDNCFSDFCTKKEEYFCLNMEKGNTLHICGKTDEYQKRRRSVLVQDPVNSIIAYVYSIACPVGYFQPNKKISFNSCVKDVSIVVQEAAGRKHVRCRSEEGYCNAKRVTYFRIESKDDNCVLAYMDLKIRCVEGRELMPDCSCEKACLVNEERDWNESLSCLPKQLSSTIIVTDHTTKATINGVTYRDGDDSSQYLHSQTTYNNTYQKTSYAADNKKDTSKEKSDKIHKNPFYLVAMIALVIFVVPVIAIIILVIRKRISNNQEDGRRTTSAHPAGPVTLSKCKKIQYTQIDPASNEKILHGHKMALVKPFERRRDDNKVHSTEETTPKTLV